MTVCLPVLRSRRLRNSLAILAMLTNSLTDIPKVFERAARLRVLLVSPFYLTSINQFIY